MSRPFHYLLSQSIEQINERAASMARLVDSFLRGRARPSARKEAAAAVSDIRAFIRVWRPTSCGASDATTSSRMSGATGSSPPHDDTGSLKPSADALLKLAQV